MFCSGGFKKKILIDLTLNRFVPVVASILDMTKKITNTHTHTLRKDRSRTVNEGNKEREKVQSIEYILISLDIWKLSIPEGTRSSRYFINIK